MRITRHHPDERTIAHAMCCWREAERSLQDVAPEWELGCRAEYERTIAQVHSGITHCRTIADLLFAFYRETTLPILKRVVGDSKSSRYPLSWEICENVAFARRYTELSNERRGAIRGFVRQRAG